MTQVRRGVVWFASLTLVAAVLASCGGDDGLDADGPPTSRRRFPAAVVSTTTPDTTPFGQVVKPATTTTTRRGSAPRTTAVPGRVASPTTQPAAPAAPTPTPLPAARTSVAGAAWQGLVVVAGGKGPGGGTSSRVDAYDPATGHWLRGPNLPVPLHDASLGVLGDELWVVGGFTTEGDQPVAQAATYYFRPGDTDWRAGPVLNTARGGAAAVAAGLFLVIVGGQTTDGGVLETVEVLAKGDTEWRLREPMSQGRAFATALAMNGRIYAVGGRTPTASAVDDVESWRSGSSWRTESRLGSDRREGAGAGNCVAGGQNDDGVVTQIECFGTGFWSAVGQMQSPRYGLAVVSLGGWYHLIGGSTAGGTVTNTHEVFAAPA